MKNLKMFAAAIIALLFMVSCSKDEEALTTSELLIAKWGFTEFGRIYDSGTVNSSSWGCTDDYIQFSNNFSSTESYADGTDCSDKDTSTGTWSLVDGKLRFSGSSIFYNNQDYEIIELTNTILKIKCTIPAVTKKIVDIKADVVSSPIKKSTAVTPVTLVGYEYTFTKI